MLLALSLSVSSRVLTCDHDALQRSLHPTTAKGERSVLAWSDPSLGSAIRVHFDTAYLESRSSPQFCTEVGQAVAWGGSVYECLPADLFTEEQRHAVVGTLENISAFISSLLTVTPVEELTATPAFALHSPSGYATAAAVTATRISTSRFIRARLV